MVPVFVDPAFEFVLQLGEVDQPADVVGFATADIEVGDVVVAMEMFAFAAVPIQPVARAKRDPTHNGQGHSSDSPRSLGFSW